MYSILTFGSFAGLELLGLHPGVFVPIWLAIYYLLDFAVNRLWVFPTALTAKLLVKFTIYSVANWMGSAALNLIIIDAFSTKFLATPVAILLLFPVRYWIQKRFIYN